ncbi:hypothetical protein M758_4G127700 [Ceratodon purpureus]|nr:hypothetical protein M758_4G127700 [Ceratodon purpureus]
MIMSGKFEELISLDSPRSALKDTGWTDVAGLLSKVNKCMESINVLCTEGPPHRMQGGKRDMGYSSLNWSFGVHEDPSEDLMNEDSGAESESNGAGRRNGFAGDDDECPSSEDGAVPTVEDRVVSVTVGLPRRFGHPVCSDEDPEISQVTDVTPDLVTSPESTVKTSLREILRKVKVNEAVLRSAIEKLGGGVKGLQAVVDYVKHFQEASEPNAGNVNPDTFIRGLERLCSLHGQAQPGFQNQSVNPSVPSANDSETHQGSGAGINQNRQTLPNLQIRGQDEWSRNGHAGDPYTTGYTENMSGYFPNFGYPNAGNVNPDDCTRSSEQLCSPHGQTKPGSQNHSLSPAVPSTNDSEMHHGSGAGMNQTRPTLPNLQIRGQDEWSRNGHAGDPYAMGYMENMSGYFPNFCYPYPPPFASYAPFNLGVRPMYMPMMQVPYFTPSYEYVHKTDAITKASRKSRIARRRGHGTDPHHARPTTKPVQVGSGTVQSGNQENAVHQKVVVSSSAQVMQGLSTRDLMLILQKQLSPSGVSSLGRIVLPKKEAETHLPHLVASEGVLLTMTDFDTAQSWTFRYRFWSNNKSRMYLLENTRDFVKAHNLQERDMLSLYRDAEGSYVVRGEKNGSNQTVDAANDTTAEEDTPAEEDLAHKKQKF